MVILKYGNTQRIFKKQRPKVRCPECGCVMMLDNEDYTVLGESDLCFNPFKSCKIEGLRTDIKYECAYCKSENKGTVRRYGLLKSVLIRIFDFFYEHFDI